MMINAIDGCTRVIGKSQGYLGLPVRDQMIEDAGGAFPVMVSSWQPAPQELAALIAGAPIHITLHGIHHPPIMVSVGDVPEI